MEDPHNFWAMTTYVLITAMHIGGPSLAWAVAATMLICIVVELLPK